MQNVLRSNSCKVCWFGFRKVEVLVVVFMSAVYYGPTVVVFMSAVYYGPTVVVLSSAVYIRKYVIPAKAGI